MCNDGVTPRFTPQSVCQFVDFEISNLLNGSSFDPYDFFIGAYAFHIHYKSAPPTHFSYFKRFEEYYQSYLPNLNVR